MLATSWGPGDNGVVEGMKEKMKCEYVKQVEHPNYFIHVLQVRYMLLSVVHYYQSEIDVMAFSMGSPITRKVTELLS